MSRHLFGWSYPPGVSRLPWDDCPEPSKEGEAVCIIFDELHAGAHSDNPVKAEDAIVKIVEDLAYERDQLRELLQATLRHLPERGPEPACTCKNPTNEFGWCERHDGGWQELTLKEEIQNFIRREEEKESGSKEP